MNTFFFGSKALKRLQLTGNSGDSHDRTVKITSIFCHDCPYQSMCLEISDQFLLRWSETMSDATFFFPVLANPNLLTSMFLLSFFV